MSDNEMLYCLVAFILGWFVSRQMGNGFSVGGKMENATQNMENAFKTAYEDFANNSELNNDIIKCRDSCDSPGENSQCSLGYPMCRWPYTCNTDHGAFPGKCEGGDRLEPSARSKNHGEYLINSCNTYCDAKKLYDDL